jgi:hypothetical protein
MRDAETGSRPKAGRPALLAAALAVLALSATAAAEGAPSRAEYVDRLESICKPRIFATQRAMKGVRGDVREEHDAVAAGKFARGTRIFGATVKSIAAVPRPPRDAATLEKWFGYLNRQEAYLKGITANLRAGRTIAAQRLTARFIHNGNLANDVVLAFGFDYCSFKFSRFG